MDPRKIITGVLLVFVTASIGYLVYREFRTGSEREPSRGPGPGGETGTAATQGAPGEPARSGHRVIAYYLHTTRRCPTCRKIESYTSQTMKTAFSPQLEKGTLEYYVLNVEAPENAHFIRDYRLTTKSVILADYQDGTQTRWKNLDRVWQYVGDRQTFMDYIEQETRDFLGELMYE